MLSQSQSVMKCSLESAIAEGQHLACTGTLEAADLSEKMLIDRIS